MRGRGFAAALVVLISCSSDKPASSEGPKAKKVSTKVAGTTGTLKGTVKFEGAAPEMPELPRFTESGKPKDPACDSKAKAEYVVVNGGGVKDAVVRLAVGAAPAPKDAEKPRPALIDQKDCHYTPHVVALQTGQKLAFRNSDATMHNVHTYKGEESDVNIAQPKGDPDKELDVTVPAGDTPYHVKCDVHPWMNAYALVTDHPYFTVTGDDGSFKLDNLPLGTYKLQVWHPYLGQKTVDVTVEAGKTTEVTLPAYVPGDYKAPQ